VRVRLAWQPEKEEGSDASPWIRVTLPFASDGSGVKFRPEKGDEVMVSFEEGNVERPYVTGFLLSPSSNNKWGWLPDKSITSTNGHSITFNDGIDGSSFFQGLLPGLKLIRSYWPTSNFPPLLQDVDWCRGMTGGMTISDRMGLYKIDLNSSSRSVLIQSSMGNVKIDAFTGISISAPNGDIKIEGKNIKLEASDTISIESGTAVKHRYLPGDTPYTEGSAKWNTPAGRVIADIGLSCFRGVRNRIVDSAIDVNLIRTAIDVFLRPIDGTTKIRSNTYMRIEAGKGSTEYPRDAREDRDKERTAPDFYYDINAIASTAKSRVETVQKAFKNMCKAIEAFNGVSGKNGANANEAVIKFNDIKGASYAAKTAALAFDWEKLDLKDIPDEKQLEDNYTNEMKKHYEQKPESKNDKYKKHGGGREAGRKAYFMDQQNWINKKEQIQIQYNEAQKERIRLIAEKKKPIEDTAKQLSKAIHLYYKATKVNFKSSSLMNDTVFTAAFDAALGKLEFNTPEIDISVNTNKDSFNNWKDLKTHYMRTAVSLFLSEANVGDKINNKFLRLSAPAVTVSKDHLENELNWKNMIDSIVSDPKLPKTKSNGELAMEWAVDRYGKLAPSKTGNRYRWKVGVEGKILISDNSEKTLTFDNNGHVKTTDNAIMSDKACDQLKRVLGSIGTNVE
jgi:hypothetical protein